MGDQELESLLADAAARPVVGWDFSCDGRIFSQEPEWDFTALVAARLTPSPDLLDMGTGGGEWLGALPGLPPRVVATEGWAPNIPVARGRLEPLGIEVVPIEGAPDNNQQTADDDRGLLPFPDQSFSLIVNRHESFNPREVARVLRSGGVFMTRQVGDGFNHDLLDLLKLPRPVLPDQPWTLALAVEQVTRAGLTLEERAEGVSTTRFADVGALVWYLKAIPWAIPGFRVDAFRTRLASVQEAIERTGPLAIREPVFWLAARKP